MKELLLNYIKMLKAGFFYKTFIYALIFIIPSVVKALSTVRSDYYETIFVIIVGFIVMSLSMNEISEKNYILCLTLPMRTKDIISIAYLHTYIIYILGFLGTLFVSISSHQKLPMLYLLFIVLFLLYTNFLYPVFTCSELKLSTNSDSAIWGISAFASMSFVAIFSYYIITIIDPDTVFIYELLAIVTTSLIAAFTLKKSIKITFKKVMGLKI